MSDVLDLPPQDARITLHIKAWEILGLNLHLKTLTGRDQIQVEQYWVSNLVTTFSVPIFGLNLRLNIFALQNFCLQQLNELNIRQGTWLWMPTKSLTMSSKKNIGAVPRAKIKTCSKRYIDLSLGRRRVPKVGYQRWGKKNISGFCLWSWTSWFASLYHYKPSMKISLHLMDVRIAQIQPMVGRRPCSCWWWIAELRFSRHIF